MPLADRFLDRYSPYSKKAYGEYCEGQPEPARTIKRLLNLKAVTAHLAGKVGLGLVPLDVEVSRWGAIDIDNHASDKPPDLKELAIQFQHFPGVVVTRSKSGGAHIYFFLQEPIPGKEIRSLIHKVAMATGLAGCEVFPKQNKIHANSYGNWINLPYFGGDKSNRYGVRPDGERIPLKDFVALPRSTPAQIESVVDKMHIGSPPCIERLLVEPPAQGYRNQALFSLAIFFKRSAPGKWREETSKYAISRMVPPLPEREIQTIIRSVGNKDYLYRCNESPLKELCNKAECLKAKFGLTAEEHQQQGEPVKFISLTKYLTEPPVWDLQTELGNVRLVTKTLLSHAMLRAAIAEKYLKIIPRIKAEEWDARLAELLATCKICEVPEDSTASGLIWNALIDFTLTAYSEDEYHNTPETEDLRWEGGIPIKREGMIYFSGKKFINWLRRAKRAEGMTAPQIYMALKDKGVDKGRIRIGKRVERAWSFEASKIKTMLPTYTEEPEEF